MNNLVLFGFLMASASALIGYTFWIGSQGRELAPGEQAPTNEQMRKKLLWGLFYVNADDPRGWVPKVYGVGKTTNFRKPHYTYIFVCLLIDVIIACGLIIAHIAP